MIKSALLALLLACTCSTGVAGRRAGADPLDSPRWGDMRKEMFPASAGGVRRAGQGDRPLTAENAMNVPVSVDASALPGVGSARLRRLQPHRAHVRFEPTGASPASAFASSCSNPPGARRGPDRRRPLACGRHLGEHGGRRLHLPDRRRLAQWQKRLGEVSSRVWAAQGRGERIRLRIIHPIDTGLAAGIPAFFLQDLDLTDDKASPDAHRGLRAHRREPGVHRRHPVARASAGYRVSGRDNNGNAISAVIEK
jgi:sulfur-oxidizing protein SoxY